jgi:hypothetical protein
MATVLLQVAGAFVGGLLGPVGSAIGSAAGALAGYSIDKALIDGTRRIEGPRLTGARPFSAEDGAGLPRVYGTARLGGILIWATRFEETATSRRQGGKGGPKVTEYTYFANVAFALCEGEIAAVRRVWADGRELDLTGLEMRVHRGGADQLPDPLIEAKQGAVTAPAYHGTAYVVFERLPLADFGNRIPQIQFEVLRPVGRLRMDIRAVALIPGATEYGLSSTLVTRTPRPGETIAENRHVLHAGTDIAASLDELQAICPSIENVALVVSWFGDDLRAGACRIRPAVTAAEAPGVSEAWRVSGVARTDAMVVSRHDGAAAYGGTPSDRSVMSAIAEIRARGLKVTLYPFIMMDVPAGNTLPDPHGGDAQAVYPWRGRITCMPAAGQPGTVDGSPAGRSQVEALVGSAAPGHFVANADGVSFTGSPGDWGYRRLVLHYAKLAQAAGGVDAFLVGSELRGLTQIRDGAGAYPFVEALCTLADEAKAMLGPATKVTYAADWSEYFGHRPDDDSGDFRFNLDPLWARASIDAIGIDNYMPLSDWRDEDYAGGNPDGASGPYDPLALRAAIAGGEGYDWHYDSTADRLARRRSPIEDGAYGKPWVFRYKDLVSWWSNPHHDRFGGVESGTPTGWIPRSKPIWFTELGCPAVDKGPNQPNVFVDPKSTESFVPYFSSGMRSDLAPRRFLSAHMGHWLPGTTGFEDGRNPLSDVYGGRMVDPQRIYLWCWDARPFPAFPAQGGVWSDGGNWHRGHWLNGRLEGLEAGDLINAILADHGLPEAAVGEADGAIQGYVVDEPGSARSALEPLTSMLDLAVIEAGGGLTFRTCRAWRGEPSTLPDGVVEDDTVAEATRLPDHELPGEVVFSFRDPLADFQAATVRSVRIGTTWRGQETIGFPGVIEREQAQQMADEWLRRAWTERETAIFRVPAYDPRFEPGALVAHDGAEHLVTEVEDGLLRRVRTRRIERTAPAPTRSVPAVAKTPPALRLGTPHVVLLDLPSRTGTAAPQDHLRVAAWQRPWKTQAVLVSPEDSSFDHRATLERPANLGRLTHPLAPGRFEGRIDRRDALTVALFDAEAASVGRLQLLNGANGVAVRSTAGPWEVLQFETAEEVSAGIWRFGSLLRGQLGTADAMAAGSAEGADVVLLDDRVKKAGLGADEIGLALTWRVGPSGTAMSDQTFATVAARGGQRAALPWSPVHLRCRRLGGDLAFSWVRRSRIGADDWEPLDIPLGEDREEYLIEIATTGGTIVRSTTSTVPGWTYDAASIAADFGAPPPALALTVAQLSLSAGWGVRATRRFTL